MQKQLRTGYCIFINTFCQGPVPIVSDENGDYVVFETALEAQREIVDTAQIRLQEFLDGERDFDDATTVEEYVAAVTVNRDGTLTDGDRNRFSGRVQQCGV